MVLAFSCFVFTRDRRLLLTMRGPAKTTLPGVWTNSCHGHPAPGEPLTDAVARTLRDELGLSTAEPELVLSGFFHGDERCPVYRVVTDERPRPDPAEVGDFEWVDWADFVYAVETGDITVSPWCRSQVAALRVLGADPLGWPATGAQARPAA